MSVRILIGDALEQLRLLPDESVHCCVTSPPYYGLRDYGVAGQIGLEPSPDEYVAALVAVFGEVRRVLRKDATLWLNIGDSYNARPGQRKTTGLKPKDLIGIPWLLAFALRADGWWLRSDIIWSKPAPMPESVTDRPTAAHEHIFLLSKSARYFYDADVVKEPAISGHDGGNGYARPAQLSRGGRGSAEGWRARPAEKFHGAYDKRPGAANERNGRDDPDNTTTTRNLRNVWHLGPEPFTEAHFATFPTELPRRAIMAGCPKQACAQCGRAAKGRHGAFTTGEKSVAQVIGWEPTCVCDAGVVPGTVLDCFCGAGTTGLVADRLGRDAILIELNPEYAAMARRRITADSPLFAIVA